MTVPPTEISRARRRRRGRGKPGLPARGRAQPSPAPAVRAERGRARAAGPAHGLPGLTLPGTTFEDLGVPAPLLAALSDAGITAPFPIQAATLPDSLAGMDILGRGRTGSGKTLGFSIPLVAGLAGGHT